MNTEHNSSDLLYEVQRASELAKLSFSREEMLDITEDLRRILDFASLLSEIGTEGFVSTSTFSAGFREDVTAPPTERDRMLASSHTRTEELFTVPRVVE